MLWRVGDKFLHVTRLGTIIMTISDDNRIREIVFTKVGSEYAHYSSVQVDVTIKTNSLQGRFSSVWFDKLSIDRFLSELKQLDETRKGEAKLESMSPDECVLIIKNIDAYGHLGVIIKVRASKGYNYERQVNFHNLEIGFEIDPTSLGNIQAELKRIK
ncbi:hypothetical protein D770_04970 [Flammeovirgaceae bacterium 311]|nr:hypothetical protein D770_04970 [Flammeovirgaceae bacterium 311]